jgi:hypothetical protein
MVPAAGESFVSTEVGSPFLDMAGAHEREPGPGLMASP